MNGTEENAAIAPPRQDAFSAPATPEQQARFDALQRAFAESFPQLFADPGLPRTVVVAPSLSLDQEVMAKIEGVNHYEERMLCLLLLLRMPRTKVVYLTSLPIHDSIIDYYLHLLPGVPREHARRRLTLLSCDDASLAPLTRKILDRPRLLNRIRQAIEDPSAAHLTCFTVSALERELALTLGLPVYGCDPSLSYWGTKSGSRRVFREAGVEFPDGFEDLVDADGVVAALTTLKTRQPTLDKAVVKINEGFSGEGNAVFDLRAAPSGEVLEPWVRARLPEMAFEAQGMTWELFEQKLRLMGGIVEAFVPGEEKTSPSAQLRVDPTGAVEAISTHDQILGGQSGQIFLGCQFPAAEDYRLEIQAAGLAIGRALARKGVLGRFGVDFISVRENGRWRHFAIEINLRKGGTTHPFQMLQFLTDGSYDAETGQFLTTGGQPRCYYASDNLESPVYRGLTPFDLIDIAVVNGLHFHAASGEGVAFHLIGALSEFGKIGVVCIGRDPERAEALFQRTVAVLDAEGTAEAE